jgi:hypothetical protein
VFGAVAAAAEALDLAGAVLTVDDTGIALHMLGRDRELNLRSGGTMSLEPGGSYSVKVPKIILNP